MKTYFIIVMGVIFAIFFTLSFQSLDDFFTRESVVTYSFIFSVLIFSILINDLYLAYKENKVEPIQTYFDAEDEIINLDEIKIEEGNQNINQVLEIKKGLEKTISPFDLGTNQ